MKSENEMLKSNLESQKKQQADILKTLQAMQLRLDDQRRESTEQLALETGELNTNLQ